ncbi:MAG: HTH domain-containing protein [Bacteroidales bacterium]|nr:HTH domain-containing protein [Bacteroidales bacterium]
MESVKLLSALSQMDQLIRFRKTGTPEDFACRLGISVRTLYNYLKILKELGADIQYNTYNLSYEYLSEIRLYIGYL